MRSMVHWFRNRDSFLAAISKLVFKSLDKGTIHEAINDGIPTRGGISEEMKQGESLVAECIVDLFGLKEWIHRLNGKDRRPTDEKDHHNHEKHFDDFPFARDVLFHL